MHFSLEQRLVLFSYGLDNDTFILHAKFWSHPHEDRQRNIDFHARLSIIQAAHTVMRFMENHCLHYNFIVHSYLALDNSLPSEQRMLMNN